MQNFFRNATDLKTLQKHKGARLDAKTRFSHKTCLVDFEHFQTRPNYNGTFRVLKVEKPEKVVWASSKSFSALFLETLHKKNFFELPCWGGVRFLKNEQMCTGPLTKGN